MHSAFQMRFSLITLIIFQTYFSTSINHFLTNSGFIYFLVSLLKDLNDLFSSQANDICVRKVSFQILIHKSDKIHHSPTNAARLKAR